MRAGITARANRCCRPRTDGRWSPRRSWAASTARPRSDRACGLRRVQRDHPRATPAPGGDCGDDLGAGRSRDCVPAPDVVVVGAGFAGLSAAVALCGAVRACWCWKRGRRWVVARPRSPIPKPAKPSTTASTRYSAATTRPSGSCGRSARLTSCSSTISSRSRSSIEAAVITAAVHAPAAAFAPGRRSAAMDGALWRDRAAALADWTSTPRAARRHRRGQPIDPREQQETVGAWLRRHRQTARLCALLWEPLAVAALNQQMDVAAAAPFVRVLAQMFGGSRLDAAIGLPRVPLDALYAAPAARWLAGRGSEVRTGSGRTIVCAGSAVSHVEVRGERHRSRRRRVCSSLARTWSGRSIDRRPLCLPSSPLRRQWSRRRLSQ